MLGRQQQPGKHSDDDAAPSHLLTNSERPDYGARLKKLRCGITLVAERSDRRNSHLLWRQMISFRSPTHQAGSLKARLGVGPANSIGYHGTAGIVKGYQIPARHLAVQRAPRAGV